MKHAGNDRPTPQAIEGITEAKWIARVDWKIVEANTFPSVMDVLRAYEAAR
jgi:hypothetical protein